LKGIIATVQTSHFYINGNAKLTEKVVFDINLKCVMGAARWARITQLRLFRTLNDKYYNSISLQAKAFISF